MQELIKEKDPAFYATAEINNPQRIMRALEVVDATGTSILQFHKGNKVNRDFEIIRIGLELPREELYRNINARVGNMMQQGLLKEVHSLLPHRQLNALQTVGYKELFDHFDNKMSVDQAVEEIKKNTRHYAKRQMTWFKKDPAIKWVHPFEFRMSNIE